MFCGGDEIRRKKQKKFNPHLEFLWPTNDPTKDPNLSSDFYYQLMIQQMHQQEIQKKESTINPKTSLDNDFTMTGKWSCND